MQQYIDRYIQQYLEDQARKRQTLGNYLKGQAREYAGNLASNALGDNALGKFTGDVISGGVNKAVGNLAGNAIGNALGTTAGTAGATAAGAGTAAGGSAAGAMGGPVGALIGLGISALQGNHRNAAKKQGEAMLKANEQMNEALMNEGEQQLANNQQQLNGIATGYAAPIQFTGNAQPNQINDNAINNYYNENLPALPSEGSATEALNKKGGLTGLASGVNNFMRGFSENYNNGFRPENLTADKFAVTSQVPNTQLNNYQNDLLSKGYAQNVVDAVADKKNSGYKEIDQWIKDNPQAYNPTTTQVDYYDKGKMGKLGEFFGTVARTAQNPAVQGLIAGVAGGALSGNPLYGLGLAQKYANQRAMSNVYKDYLAQNGVETDPGLFGNLSSTDMNNMAKLAETKAWHEYMNKKYQADNQIKEEKNNIAKQNADTNAKNADSRAKDAQTRADKQKNGTTITHVSTGGGTTTKKTGGKTQKTTAPSGQYVIMQAPNGKKYNVPVERIKEYKSYGGKIVG